MNREKVIELLPILQAFAEGKTIEYNCNGNWIEYDNFNFQDKMQNYRIKPMPKYRPFVNIEECWQEMQKHQPFGWVIRNNVRKIIVAEVLSDGVVLHNQSGSYYDFEEANRILTFVDGTVFGIKEE